MVLFAVRQFYLTSYVHLQKKPLHHDKICYTQDRRHGMTESRMTSADIFSQKSASSARTKPSVSSRRNGSRPPEAFKAKARESGKAFACADLPSLLDGDKVNMPAPAALDPQWSLRMSCSSCSDLCRVAFPIRALLKERSWGITAAACFYHSPVKVGIMVLQEPQIQPPFVASSLVSLALNFLSEAHN